MPDPWPLSSLRFGGFDDPPASLETSTPRTRRPGLRRALRDTSDLARDAMNNLDARVPLLEPRNNRRRQRSPSLDLDSSERRSPQASGSRRRSKRRKLEDASAGPTLKPPIKYGHSGQVEAGRLKLELISCDGGTHMDPRHPATYLGAENVLRHDKSVYCSERWSASMTLKHADDTPFCLEKLYIVGPEHGFTAPVREGLVYVAMDLRDLRKYQEKPVHARRAGIDTYWRQRNHGSLRASPERLTLSDALRDTQVNAALDRHEREYARRADEAHDLAPRNPNSTSDDYELRRTDAEAQCDVPPFFSAEVPDITIEPIENASAPVTVLSDEDAGPEESSSQEVLDFRLGRLRLMQRRHADESWDREDRWRGLAGLHLDANDHRDAPYGLGRIDTMMARSRVYDSPTRDAPAPTPPPPPARFPNIAGTALEPDDVAVQDAKVTCARFYMKKGKHKVAIKFEPAVSGRYVLLKLWANRSNVDVQSVIAKGYGGPRFFPAKEFR